MDKTHYRDRFFQLALQAGALQFGDFVLKSGRKSPYFFNAGAFNTGAALSALGGCYAEALIDSDMPFDMLFGPAYKGIPLAVATAIALANKHDVNVPLAFDRKEAKDHGEGGSIVGAPLAGRVLIVDDVITAGTSLAGAIRLIDAAGARCAGALIALDRQERAGERPVVETLESDLGLRIVSIATLDDLVAWLAGKAGQEGTVAALHSYRERFGGRMTE